MSIYEKEVQSTLENGEIVHKLQQCQDAIKLMDRRNILYLMQNKADGKDSFLMGYAGVKWFFEHERSNTESLFEIVKEIYSEDWKEFSKKVYEYLTEEV